MLAALFALAFTLFAVAQSIAVVVVSALQQHLVDENTGGSGFDFRIAGTRFDLYACVQAALTLVLVVGVFRPGVEAHTPGVTGMPRVPLGCPGRSNGLPVLHRGSSRGCNVMSGWLAWLVRGRSLELACALALGYGASILAKDVADVPVAAVAQHVDARSPLLGELNSFASGVYLLNFEIGSTVFFYGEVLASLLALVLVGLVTLVVVRRRDRVLGA